jgi:hypothetical protein
MRRPDPRRWIYGALDCTFAALYVAAIVLVAPNRLPSAQIHLWSVPIACAVLAVGTLLGGRRGWWTAVAGGSLQLATMVFMIVRILVSAAFLAGVYGAFGKAAASGALVGVAIVVELVGLLPLLQLKWLLSHAGRRAYGLPPAPAPAPARAPRAPRATQPPRAS